MRGTNAGSTPCSAPLDVSSPPGVFRLLTQSARDTQNRAHTHTHTTCAGAAGAAGPVAERGIPPQGRRAAGATPQTFAFSIGYNHRNSRGALPQGCCLASRAGVPALCWGRCQLGLLGAVTLVVRVFNPVPECCLLPLTAAKGGRIGL